MKIKIDDDYENIEDKGIVHDNTDENIITYESYEVETIENNKKENVDIRGKIKVISRLGNKDGTLISSSKINLYMLNGISPRLISSKLTNPVIEVMLKELEKQDKIQVFTSVAGTKLITNEKGQVTFTNLKKGSYRVIAIVDRKFFQKPIYMEWNEVTIDEENQEETVVVINRIRK